MEILIQAIGIVAMTFNILSYQGKNAKQIIFMQFVGATLFSINFFMLGAYTGAMLNAFAVIRALYLLKVKNPPKFAVYIFYAFLPVLYCLTFLVFHKTPTGANLLTEVLPTAAMFVQTYCFFSKKANTIRYFSYFVSPCWLIYNSINYSIGGILCETFALISITVGIIRAKMGSLAEWSLKF